MVEISATCSPYSRGANQTERGRREGPEEGWKVLIGDLWNAY